VKGLRPPAEIVVRGVGKQFREFIYPGPDDNSAAKTI
jgi:hypothetical protein